MRVEHKQLGLCCCCRGKIIKGVYCKKHYDIAVKHSYSINRLPKIRLAYVYKESIRHGTLSDILLGQYVKLLQQGCHYCGEGLENSTKSGLDRINNSKGYTLDNVLPCCGACNQIRGDNLTVQEMEVAMKAILDYRKMNA